MLIFFFSVDFPLKIQTRKKRQNLIGKEFQQALRLKIIAKDQFAGAFGRRQFMMAKTGSEFYSLTFTLQPFPYPKLRKFLIPGQTRLSSIDVLEKNFHYQREKKKN